MLMQLDPNAPPQALPYARQGVPMAHRTRMSSRTRLFPALRPRESHHRAIHRRRRASWHSLTTIDDHDAQVLSRRTCRKFPEVDGSAHRKGPALRKRLRRSASLRAALAMVLAINPEARCPCSITTATLSPIPPSSTSMWRMYSRHAAASARTAGLRACAIEQVIASM